MSPTLLAKPRPAAVVRPAPAVPVHWAASPCTAPGRVTGQPGEVTCPACVAWQVEAAWSARRARPAVTR